ncbi:hypothetical protein ACFL1X_03155 [Candidatus Hydrogenedentota bacterium]
MLRSQEEEAVHHDEEKAVMMKRRLCDREFKLQASRLAVEQRPRRPSNLCLKWLLNQLQKWYILWGQVKRLSLTERKGVQLMKKALTTIPGLLLIAILASCEAEWEWQDRNVKDLGSHRVVVKPRSNGTTLISSPEKSTYQYTCGEVSVTIRSEELSVNGMSYGKLNAGDAVLVDNGRVSVAGEKRQGTPMSDKEIAASAPVKENTKELAGYTVTVRPGSPFTATTSIFGKHTFTVGNTKVSIKDDVLFVREKSYGKLEKGDSILVENLSVYVSGKAREPRK